MDQGIPLKVRVNSFGFAKRGGGIPISPLPLSALSPTPFKTAAARAWGKWLLKFNLFGYSFRGWGSILEILDSLKG